MKKYIKKTIKNTLETIFGYEILEEPALLARANKKQIRMLKNKFKGKRCFVIGNGPSLNKLNLERLEDEYSFGVNGIFYKTDEMGFKPTFYVVEDTHVMRDNTERINSYKTDYKFFPSIYRKYIKNNSSAVFFNMNRGFYEERSPYYQVPRFSVDCAKQIYCGQSVSIINLQLAYYLGFSEIYLIGMDFSYNIPDSAEVDGNDITSTEDDVNHFHPDYFGKGKKWHDPKLHNVLACYKMAKVIYESAGRKIFNATAGGKLEVFDRVNYDTLFK